MLRFQPAALLSSHVCACMCGYPKQELLRQLSTPQSAGPVQRSSSIEKVASAAPTPSITTPITPKVRKAFQQH